MKKELLFRQVDLTNNKKIVSSVFSKSNDIEIAISTFESLKQENAKNQTFKEWTSQCFEYVDGKNRILTYIMFLI